jgi:hypothetical protein
MFMPRKNLPSMTTAQTSDFSKNDVLKVQVGLQAGGPFLKILSLAVLAATGAAVTIAIVIRMFV